MTKTAQHRPACTPFINLIAENSRIHTKQTLRRALIALGYPLSRECKDRELTIVYKRLRERGWVARRTGTRDILHCAPDVTDAEALAYCASHGIPPMRGEGELRKHSKRVERPEHRHEGLSAFVRAISGTYARARFSKAWRTA